MNFTPCPQTFRYIQRKRFPISSRKITTLFAGIHSDVENIASDLGVCAADLNYIIEERTSALLAVWPGSPFWSLPQATILKIAKKHAMLYQKEVV